MSAPRLSLERVTEALIAGGRRVAADPETGTVDVTSTDPQLGHVLGVVRPHAVVFYALHRQLVPAEAMPTVAELALRATADQFGATFELDLDTGTLSVRTSVDLGGLDLDDLVLGEMELGTVLLGHLLLTAVEEAEAVACRYADVIEDVIAGRAEPRDAARRARHSELDALHADLAELEDQLTRPTPSPTQSGRPV